MDIVEFFYLNLRYFTRRRLLICLFTILLILLFVGLRKSSNYSPAEYCDAERLQEHYMNNLSVYHLMQSKPIRSNPFEYELANRSFCGQANLDIDLLIFIVSKSSSYERRNAIRRTYGNLNYLRKYTSDALSKLEVRLLFLINADEYRSKGTRFEENLHNDIVQVNIPEVDLISTYGDLAAFHWSSTYCPQARFIFKMDDFVFLNPFLLLKFIQETANDRMNRESARSFNSTQFCSTLDARLPLLLGFVHSDEDVRQAQLPVTPDEYPCDIYPNYLNDHAYLISNDARDLILCTFYRHFTDPSVLSNVYLTGILPEYLNIERQALSDYKMKFGSMDSCTTFFAESNPQQAFACVIDTDLASPITEHYRSYWQSLLNTQTKMQEASQT